MSKEINLGLEVTGVVMWKEIDITWETATGVIVLLDGIKEGSIKVLKTTVETTTAFDGIAPTLTIGTNITPTLLMTSAETGIDTEGVQSKSNNLLLDEASTTSIQCDWTKATGTPSAGELTVRIEYIKYH